VKAVSLSNQKGGVGKTTMVTNLGTSFAKRGKRVLLIDLDPQHTMSNIMGMSEMENGLPELLLKKCGIEDCIYKWDPPTDYLRNKYAGLPLYILPTSESLNLLDYDFYGVSKKEGLLIIRSLLERIGEMGEYDIALLDLEPGLSIFTRNGLAASDYVLVPIHPDSVTVDATALMLSWVHYMEEKAGRKLDVLGLLVNEFNTRSRVHNDAKDYLLKQKHIKVYRPFIKSSTLFYNSQSSKMPAVIYEPWHQGSRDLEKLALEVLKDVT